MRLFIAINFDEDTKKKIIKTAKRLEDHLVKGNATTYDNLHITLVFIGEISQSKISHVVGAMESSIHEKFSITIGGIGKFRRNTGDVFWLDINGDNELYDLNNRLCDNLYKAGFAVEERPYRPHLTLFRGVKTKGSFDIAEFNRSVQNITFNVSKISLIKSERIGGKLKYTEIASKELR